MPCRSRSSVFKCTILLHKSCRRQQSQAFSYPCSLLQFSRQITDLKRVNPTSKLLDSCADFGSRISVLRSARETRTRVWNSVMKEQSDLGSFDLAFRVFVGMRRLSVEVDAFTLPLVNRATSMLGNNVLCGQMIHCVGIQLGFRSDIYFCNTLIEAYVKFDKLGFARRVFDEMCHRDLVSWTSMVSAYVGKGDSLQAFELFHQMRLEVEPNSVTMIGMLQACLNCVSVMQGKQLHSYLSKAGFLDDNSVRNSLLNLYSKWPTSEHDVETLFYEYAQNDAISWNIYISFHSSKGNDVVTTQRFSEMLLDATLNAETLAIMATTLTKSRNLDHGQQLHCLAIKFGSCDHVLLTCFLNLYSKCGDIDSSTKLFTELPHQNDIAWSSMMSGFIEHGHHREVIELLRNSELQNKFEIIGSLLDGYANLGALHKGKEIHAYFLRNLSINNSLENSETSILNMYTKCGNVSSARNCFHSMMTKDVIAWTSMIEALGTYGLGLEAIEIFDKMLNEGVLPNSITFLSLLSACAHSGLALQGIKLFNDMKWRFGIEPGLRHYTCIVDLLGRSGKLREALCMIVKMQCCEDSRIWGALLASSRTYMDMKIGVYAAKRVMEMEPGNVGYHVVLSNMKASVERWSEVETARTSVDEMELKKVPGWSCIETKGRIVGFVSWDTSHPQSGEIGGVLSFLRCQIQDLDIYCLQQMSD